VNVEPRENELANDRGCSFPLVARRRQSPCGLPMYGLIHPSAYSPHSAPSSTFLRIFFSTRTRWVIYLQNRVIDHIKYSILLGWLGNITGKRESWREPHSTSLGK
jgi:hypothetical protein